MAGLRLPSVEPRFQQAAQSHMGSAVGAYGSLTKDTAPEDPGPTAGGAIGAGIGGAAAGASIGSAIAGGATAGSAAGPWGAAIGAVVGIAAYLLS